jgi:hypothetical protein
MKAAIAKAVFSAVLVLGVCGFAHAADKADPVGTWKCEYEIGGQKRTSTLAIKKDGEKLAGTMSWPDQKETNLKELKLVDDTLTFTADRKLMDVEITVDYKLAINGDELKGKGGAEFGGQRQEFDISAKRDTPVGTWKCEYEIGGQQRTSTLTIKKDGDKLAGTMSWPDQKETNLKELKLKDGTLTFTADRKLMDAEITVEYKLTMTGDELKGKGGAEFGGQRREFDISGKREKKDK